MRLGTLTRSSGSAILELGATQVAVAVHGPKPAAAGDARGALQDEALLQVDVEFAAFAGRPPRPNPRVRGCALAAAGCASQMKWAPLRRTCSLRCIPAPQLVQPANSLLACAEPLKNEIDMQGPDLGKQELEELLAEALEATLLLDRYPKATIEVHALVLAAGGGEAAALAMAAGLAAAGARLDSRAVLSAATLVRTCCFWGCCVR